MSIQDDSYIIDVGQSIVICMSYYYWKEMKDSMYYTKFNIETQMYLINQT